MAELNNPEIRALVAAYAKLLVSNDWHPRRQLSARASLENLVQRALAIGAAGASVSHDRLAEQGALELCIGIVAAIDPKLVATRPELPPEEAMRELILDALCSLKARGAA